MPALPRRMPRSLIGGACALALVALLPLPVTAQPAAPAARAVATAAPSVATAPLATAPAATPAPSVATAGGPLLGGTRAGAVPVAASEAAAPDARDAAMVRRRALRESQIMMIVGGAAIALGFITGDTAGDILILGGAAVGLAGLYFYLH